MISFPACKINLGLHIINKREDGFHNLETVFLAMPWCDILEIIEDKNNTPGHVTFISDGLTIDGDISQNIAVKAYKLLNEYYMLPAIKMFLYKIIPMGAGLGGGSSDAAYVLKLLNNLFSLNISNQTLKNYAMQLGSDCAFFINEEIQFASGRGEILKPISVSLKGYYFVLIYSHIHVKTADAFAGLVLQNNNTKSIEEVLKQPIETWRYELKNDFESSVFLLYPEIEKIKKQLYEKGALYAAMSGSGSTVFGIFDKAIDVNFLKKEHLVYCCSL